MRKAEDPPPFTSASSLFTIYCSGFSHVAMLSPKPLDVVILQKYQDGGEAHWERYEERGEKMKQSNDGWSCYILATDGEVSAVGALVAV